MTAKVDVAVAGAGPAGAAAAIALGRTGLTTALIEPAAGDEVRVGETVPADLRHELEALDSWPSFAGGPHLPVRGTSSSWGEAELRFRDALASPLGGGWHLERSHFDATLVGEARRHGARIFAGYRLAGLERSAAGWSLSLTGPRGGTSRLAAAFVVDATGRRALVARRCGAACRRLDRLVAVCAVYAWPSGEAPQRHMLVEAAEQGWWYTARLPRGRAMACWMSDSDLVRAGGLHHEGPWSERLAATHHLRELLVGAERVSPIAVRSAASHCLTRAAGESWVAVGDAAAAFDPLSSAGIVLALRSGREAAAAVAGRLGGDGAPLAAYERRVAERFTRYWMGRRSFYALETRWPSAAFWRRRQAPPRQTA
jgi:flavin-dependent dehydrogenase